VDHLKAIIPLMQTVLWVGLIGSIIYRYHRSIESIIESLKRRIDSGGGLKLGPVELAALAKPLDPEQQIKKLNEDVAQLVEAERAAGSSGASPPLKRENIQAQYLRAEDLALRELQSEYDVTIGRQIQLGSNLAFDGAFVQDGRLYIIEVKYSRRLLPRAIVQQTVERCFSRIRSRAWKSTRLIFAVVYEDLNIDLAKEKERIWKVVAEYGEEADVRCYHLAELATKFGIAGTEVSL
jgi:hypothetical protein